MLVADLVRSRAEGLCRSDLVDSLKATATAARTVARRNERQRRNDALAFAHRLDRIIQFLETDTLPSNVDEFDKAIFEQVRANSKHAGNGRALITRSCGATQPSHQRFTIGGLIDPPPMPVLCDA